MEEKFITWFRAVHAQLPRYTRFYDEDIAQEVFLKMLVAIKAGTLVNNFLGYFITCHKNLAINAAKKARIEITSALEHFWNPEEVADDFSYALGTMPKNILTAECTDPLAELIAAEEREAEERLSARRMEFIMSQVRGNFSEADISIFEIVTGLAGQTSSGGVARMLGLNEKQVYNVMYKIKAHVRRACEF